MIRPSIGLSALGVAFSVLVLAGCAGGPTPSAPNPIQAPARGYGEMAPVPNPVSTPAPRPKSTTPVSRNVKSPPATAPQVQPKPPGGQKASSADVQRAAGLRVSGLEQLNRGAADQAVELLQRAQRLDPTNVLIRRDLERAIRINRAVSAK